VKVEKHVGAKFMENSVHQARWLIIPLFGFSMAFLTLGVLLNS
jgi:hypothetical protein